MSQKYEIPKVSVVVPVYNNDKYLHQAIGSLVNQTLKDIEIIIVNDGSTDGSLDIIKEYASKDSRIIIIDQENGGLSNAINNGIAIAKGEYLAEMDSDDYVKPEMYEELFESAKANALDIVTSNYYAFTGSNENPDARLRRFFDAPDWYGKELYPYAFYNDKLSDDYLKGFGLSLIWTSLYRREFLIENNIRWNENVRAYSDNGFWAQTKILAKKIMYVDKAYYFYRCDNSNSTINNFKKFEQDLFGEQDFIKNFLTERNLWEDLKDFYIKKIFDDYIYFALSKLPADKINRFFSKISVILSECVKENKDIAHNTFNEYEWRTLHVIINDPLRAAKKYRIEQIYGKNYR